MSKRPSMVDDIERELRRPRPRRTPRAAVERAEQLRKERPELKDKVLFWFGYQDHMVPVDLDADDATPELSTHVQGPAGEDGRQMGADFAAALAVALEDPKKRRAIVEQVLNTDPESDQVPAELRDELRDVQHLARDLARLEEHTVTDEAQREALLKLWRRASATKLVLDFVNDRALFERECEIEIRQSADGRLYTDLALLAAMELCVSVGAEQAAALQSGKLHGNGSWQSAIGECAAPSCGALFVRMGPQVRNTCCKACVARAGRARKGATTRPRPPKAPKATASPFYCASLTVNDV